MYRLWNSVNNEFFEFAIYLTFYYASVSFDLFPKIFTSYSWNHSGNLCSLGSILRYRRQMCGRQMHCISSRNNLHSDFNTHDCWRTQGAFVVMSLRGVWREALLGSGAVHPASFPLFPDFWEASCLWYSSPLALFLFSFSFIPLPLFFLATPFSQSQSHSFFLSPQRKLVPKYFFFWIHSGR